ERAAEVRAVHEDVADSVDVLEEKRDLLGALRNLKRVRHVHDAGDARQPALRVRIGGVPVLEVLLLLGQRLRSIGDLVALDDASPGRHALVADVVLYVPVSSSHGLPDAREIRLAIGRAGHSAGAGRGRPRGLTSGAKGNEISKPKRGDEQ